MAIKPNIFLVRFLLVSLLVAFVFSFGRNGFYASFVHDCVIGINTIQILICIFFFLFTICSCRESVILSIRLVMRYTEVAHCQCLRLALSLILISFFANILYRWTASFGFGYEMLDFLLAP